MAVNESSVVEGVSNEVFVSAIACSLCIMFMLSKVAQRWFPPRTLTIHPDSEEVVTETRQRLLPRSTTERDGSAQCPVCLDTVQYGLETNCGHIFCGNCVITYWRTGRWLGPVACPNCRQIVTLLMNCFTTAELNEENSEVKNKVLEEVLAYNRRFSGEPRSIWEYIQDLPTILRHALSDLVSVNGMVFVFRARIIVCILIAVLYFLVPFDFIPEAAVGVLGLVDDLFIFLIAAIYITIIYRGVLANRAAAAQPTTQ